MNPKSRIHTSDLFKHLAQLQMGEPIVANEVRDVSLSEDTLNSLINNILHDITENAKRGLLSYEWHPEPELMDSNMPLIDEIIQNLFDYGFIIEVKTMIDCIPLEYRISW